jgi:hypothetical protein
MSANPIGSFFPGSDYLLCNETILTDSGGIDNGAITPDVNTPCALT